MGLHNEESYVMLTIRQEVREELEIGAFLEEAHDLLIEEEEARAEKAGEEPKDITVGPLLPKYNPDAGRGTVTNWQWTKKDPRKKAQVVPDVDSSLPAPGISTKTPDTMVLRERTPESPLPVAQVPTDVSVKMAADSNQLINRFEEIMSQKGVAWRTVMADACMFMLKVFSVSKLSCMVGGGKIPAFCQRIQGLQEMLTRGLEPLSDELASGINMTPLKGRQKDFEVHVRRCFTSLMSLLKFEESRHEDKIEQRKHVTDIAEIMAKHGIPVDPRKGLEPDLVESVQRTWRK